MDSYLKACCQNRKAKCFNAQIELSINFSSKISVMVKAKSDGSC